MTNNAIEFYFAFPDGVFHFVCAECTAICCRGNGFGGSLKNEVSKLYSLYPAIQSLSSQRFGDYVEFITLSDGCVFLESDNYCRIEREHGNAAKPSICRLFPFNSFCLIGDTIVVRPHLICPLRLQLPARPGPVAGTHSDIELDIRKSGLLEGSYMSFRVARPSLHGSEDPSAVLAREINFRDMVSSSLGRHKFIEVVKESSQDPSALESFIVRAANILDVPIPDRNQERDGIDDILLALAPAFRTWLLSIGSEGILRVLALSEILVRRALSLSSQPASVKGVYGLIAEFRTATNLLAQGDEPLTPLSDVKIKAPQFGDTNLNLVASLILKELNVGGVGLLEVLEKAIAPSLASPDRALLVRQFGILIEKANMVRSARQKAGEQIERTQN